MAVHETSAVDGSGPLRTRPHQALPAVVALLASLNTACAARAPAASAAAPAVSLAVSLAVAPTAAVSAQRCHVTVILRLKERLAAPIAPALLGELARSANLSLVFRRTVGDGFQVLDVSSDEQDPDCSDALGRLRAEPRVASVDLDRRRIPHAQ